KLFEDYLNKIAPKTVELKLTRMHGGKPWMTEFDNKYVRAAGKAIEQGFGKTPVFNREGGSIPVVSTFQEELGVPSVLFGVGLPDENAHAPDQKLNLGNVQYGEWGEGAQVGLGGVGRRGRSSDRPSFVPATAAGSCSDRGLWEQRR